MLILYCDLCNCPVKPEESTKLYIVTPTIAPPDANKFEYLDDYYANYERYLRKLGKEVKEICPSCKNIFDKLFEYRLQGISKLTEECEDLFNLPPKENKKKDKEGNK